MKVRFIVQVIRTWNRNGYFYRCAIVTATATGKQMFFGSVGGDENVQHALHKVTGEYGHPAIFSTREDVGAREFSRINRSHESVTYYEDRITAETIKALETEGVA